jgi:hypothetical protein
MGEAIMTDSTRDAVFQEIALETAHFSAAPAAFFHAWKRGVALAGTHLFGNGTHADLAHAASVWDLCPKVQLIDHAIGVMSSGQKVFIAALVSFYNAEDGGRLFECIGVRGLADLGGLDLKRRAVIAALILNYSGW